MNHFKAAEKLVILNGADFWNMLPGGYPEDGTDQESESFGGPVFAIYLSPQRITNVEINPWNSRKGLTPTKNTFPTFKHFQSFKKFSFTIFPTTIAPAMFGYKSFLSLYPACWIPGYPALTRAQEGVPGKLGNFSLSLF